MWVKQEKRFLFKYLPDCDNAFSSPYPFHGHGAPIPGLTKRDRQTFTVTFTPEGNLGSQINFTHFYTTFKKDSVRLSAFYIYDIIYRKGFTCTRGYRATGGLAHFSFWDKSKKGQSI